MTWGTSCPERTVTPTVSWSLTVVLLKEEDPGVAGEDLIPQTPTLPPKSGVPVPADHRRTGARRDVYNRGVCKERPGRVVAHTRTHKVPPGPTGMGQTGLGKDPPP